ncbi:MAG: ROK family protein, partial [Verrucomicrobiota bacterium]
AVWAQTAFARGPCWATTAARMRRSTAHPEQASSTMRPERHRLVADRARGGAGIREQIASVVPGLMARHAIASVGVGFGGPVDPRTGQICCSHQVPGWHDFPLGDWVRELAGVPVAVENDANVAALGEALRGAGCGYGSVFWINMGSGGGGGLVVDGRLSHGARPGEAEIGHLRLDRSGRIVEDACSGWAVDRRIRAAVVAQQGPLANAVCAQTAEGGEARHLRAALEAGDPVARKILGEVADDLAFALSHAVHLFHPEIIVVGGGLSLVGEPLRAAMAAALPPYLMEAFHPGPRVALAGLGEDSVPVGALALAAAIVAP